MSRKIVNILILLLAVIYTSFAVIQLVATLQTKGGEYRALIIAAISFGVMGGAWLIVSIGRHLIKKSKFGHKLSRRLRRLFYVKKVKKG